MQKECEGCQKLIHILQTNDGSWKAFEDASASIAHRCPEYVDLKSKTPLNDHVLLTETVTRVSQVEYKIEQIKEALEKNGFHFEWS